MKYAILYRALGLSLLVLLFLGMSHEASPQAGTNKNKSPSEQRIQVLYSTLQNLDQEIRKLDTRIPEMRKEVEELMMKVASLQPPDAAEPTPPDQPKPKTVEFRPPYQVESRKQTNICLICQEGRISQLDFEAVRKAYSIRALGQANVQSLLARKTIRENVSIPSGDFDVKVEIIPINVRGNTVDVRNIQEAIRKANHPGETPAEFQSKDSSLRKRLSALSAADNIVQFAVYPDSFDAFRIARQIVWSLKFDVGWDPMLSGEPYRFGAGSAKGQ